MTSILRNRLKHYYSRKTQEWTNTHTNISDRHGSPNEASEAAREEQCCPEYAVFRGAVENYEPLGSQRTSCSTTMIYTFVIFPRNTSNYIDRTLAILSNKSSHKLWRHMLGKRTLTCIFKDWSLKLFHLKFIVQCKLYENEIL